MNSEPHAYQHRWLNGQEYYTLFASSQHFPSYPQHPESIYFSPQNGQIYFLRHTTLRKLGFPRLKENAKKLFKWKKMNFQTNLPKKDPLVSYIVCSTNTVDNLYYRMHIVQQYQDSSEVLLCHILEMNNSTEYDARWTFAQDPLSEIGDETNNTKHSNPLEHGENETTKESESTKESETMKESESTKEYESPLNEFEFQQKLQQWWQSNEVLMQLERQLLSYQLMSNDEMFVWQKAEVDIEEEQEVIRKKIKRIGREMEVLEGNINLK